MENKNQDNSLICDFETGVCEMPERTIADDAQMVNGTNQSIKVIYFTDPICSSCWGIEPQLRKLKLEYGSNIDIEYRMGGLLPDWGYNSGGINKPSDVAHHWDEASAYYDMPIDGDVWLEDPLSSSYPPSIAFKAAQLQDDEKAVDFLRVLRELLFLQKKNIAKWENISLAAQKTGLDVQLLKTDFEGTAKDLFAEDLQLAQQLGVRGFPTMFFADGSGNQEKVYGSKPYSVYENAISKLLPAATKHNYKKDWKRLFAIYPTLTSREFAELSGTPRSEVETSLERLREAGKLDKVETKNGILWQLTCAVDLALK